MTGWRVTDTATATRISASLRVPDFLVTAGFRPTAAPRDPVRFRHALAHQVRQDIWRSLRRLRGFLPVVEVETSAGGLCIAAGGALAAGRLPPNARDEVAAVLNDGGRQRRWCVHALRKAGGAAPS